MAKKTKQELGLSPDRSVRLLNVPYKGGILTVGGLPFRGKNLQECINSMAQRYINSDTGEIISFREPTSPEVISAVRYHPRDKGPVFSHSHPLCLGRAVCTTKGIYMNPPKDKKGNVILNEEYFKSLLRKSKVVGGACLYEGEDAKDFGFISYKVIDEDKDNDKFEGLARILEHTNSIPKNLKRIGSGEYGGGFEIFDFDEIKK